MEALVGAAVMLSPLILILMLLVRNHQELNRPGTKIELVLMVMSFLFGWWISMMFWVMFMGLGAA